MDENDMHGYLTLRVPKKEVRVIRKLARPHRDERRMLVPRVFGGVAPVSQPTPIACITVGTAAEEVLYERMVFDYVMKPATSGSP
jgi:hypothetical protein